jgi:glutamate-ammonia-ligase adenylyltransferase
MLVHLDAARRYYGPGGRSQTWEKQSLIKARYVAGAAGLAEEFLALVQPEVYPVDPPPERDAEVRAMKRRIETERVGRAERQRHMKLGPGGLSDVEFLAQALQLRHGGRHAALRVRNTWAALAALAAEAILPAADADTLADHYTFLTCLRQRLYLRSAGVATDLLPTDPPELRRLARAMGLPDGDALLAEYTRRTAEVRAVFTRYL